MNAKLFLLTFLVLSCLIATVVSEPNPQPGSDNIGVNPTNSASNSNGQGTSAKQNQKRRGFILYCASTIMKTIPH
ncbi:unnamed protein product [Leptidea sinapis]|uniref:Uncharacterized protein n=1 Tax=Leptidea sinapis TaxID=189913 RepID=A0A5E4QYB4_9NEOP|nr:unnamed protein product [Leptidea sinapis]